MKWEMTIKIVRNENGILTMRLLMGNQETNGDETWFSVEVPINDVIAAMESFGYIVGRKD